MILAFHMVIYHICQFILYILLKIIHPLIKSHILLQTKTSYIINTHKSIDKRQIDRDRDDRDNFLYMTSDFVLHTRLIGSLKISHSSFGPKSWHRHQDSVRTQRLRSLCLKETPSFCAQSWYSQSHPILSRLKGRSTDFLYDHSTDYKRMSKND